MKQFLFALIVVSLFSCKEESKIEEAVAQIPVSFKVERFETGRTSRSKSKIPVFFSSR